MPTPESGPTDPSGDDRKFVKVDHPVVDLSQRWQSIDPQGTLSNVDRTLLAMEDTSHLEPEAQAALVQARLRYRRLTDADFRASNW